MNTVPDCYWSMDRSAKVADSGRPQEHVGNHGIIPLGGKVSFDVGGFAAGAA